MLSLADVLRVGAQTARGAWVGAGANSGAGAAPERLSQRGAADSSLPCRPLTARSTPRGRGRRDRSRRAPPPWWHRPAWRRTRAGAGTAARTRRDDRRRDRSARSLSAGKRGRTAAPLRRALGPPRPAPKPRPPPPRFRRPAGGGRTRPPPRARPPPPPGGP